MQLRSTAVLACALCTAPAFAAPVASVPVSGITDQVYDPARGVLYLTTNNGSVERYDPVTMAFLPSWNIGVNLGAADVTPDGNYLLATEQNAGTTQGVIYRVDLSTGASTSLFYPLEGEGAGAFDIVALNDGRAIFSTNSAYSGGSTPLHSIDLSTGAITNFAIGGSDQTTERQTELWRSADGSTVFMDGTNTSAGNVRVFSTGTESYSVNTDLYTPLNGLRVALTPNGSTLAIAGSNVSAAVEHSNDLSLIKLLPDAGGGIAYDPTGTYLYDGSLNQDAILIYRTSDYTQVGSINVGSISLSPYDVPGNGMTISSDGNWLFLHSGGELYQFAITPAPEPLSLGMLIALPALLLRRRSRR